MSSRPKPPPLLPNARQVFQREVGKIVITCVEQFMPDGTVIHRVAQVGITGESFEEGKTPAGIREAYAWTSLAAGVLVNTLATQIEQGTEEPGPRIIVANGAIPH